MPEGETMFKYHGYSGPCPKPPLFQPHQRRVIDEKAELDKKATDLSNFIGSSPAFATIDPAEQERMKVQNDVMWQYSEILGARIAAFTPGARA
jgi:choline dehydrogenase-like flavoprotein